MIERRGILAWMCGATVLCLAGSAFGGSYLSRAAMLLQGAEIEARALRRRLHDKELVKVTHRLALARLEAGKGTLVPEEVVKAHPHLLLVLEAYERAADAAVRRDHEDVLVALARAREETNTFESVLKQLGWSLPR